MIHSWPIISLETVDSTNNYANVLLTENQDFNDCVISAQYQTQGRGQNSNKWESPENKNLTFSLLIHTNFLKAENQFLLSQSVALGIIDFLNKIDIKGQIKWPNDILVNEKKISGILIENSIMGAYLHSSIIGIGLNVNQEQFNHMELAATSIHHITGKKSKSQEILEHLLDCLHVRLENLKNGKYGAIQHEYLNHLFRYQELAPFKVEHEIFEGKIVGVSEFGELLLEQNGFTKRFMIQEIKHVIN